MMSGGIESAAAVNSGMMSLLTSKRYSGAGVCARRRYRGIDYFQCRVTELVGRQSSALLQVTVGPGSSLPGCKRRVLSLYAQNVTYRSRRPVGDVSTK